MAELRFLVAIHRRMILAREHKHQVVNRVKVLAMCWDEVNERTIMKNFLGKYQACRSNGDVSITVGVTRIGKINIDWDYQAQVDSNLHVVLRGIDESSPLKRLTMSHTEEDMECVREAIAEAVEARANA